MRNNTVLSCVFVLQMASAAYGQTVQDTQAHSDQFVVDLLRGAGSVKKYYSDKSTFASNLYSDEAFDKFLTGADEILGYWSRLPIRSLKIQVKAARQTKLGSGSLLEESTFTLVTSEKIPRSLSGVRDVIWKISDGVWQVVDEQWTDMKNC